MGLLDKLRSMADESNGNALNAELTDKLLRLRAHDARLVEAGYEAFCLRIKGQEHELTSLPRDIKISTGKYLQSQGREQWDKDLVDGISLFFAGVWIESSVRPGAKAAEAYQLLSEILYSVSDL